MNCLNCKRKINDNINFCPYCQANLTQSLRPDKPENSDSMAIKKHKTPKGCIIAVVIWLAVLAVVVGGVVFFALRDKNEKNARIEYINCLNGFNYSVIDSANKAEDFGSLVRDVWYNTIYEIRDSRTNKYTLKSRTGLTFNDSFNDSLARLYEDENVIEIVGLLKECQDLVNEWYLLLQNPDDEFKECFALVNSLYDDYMRLTNLVISPSGSLQSYTNEFNTTRDGLLEKYKKLDLLIPSE